jgi:hypothetical protein
MTLSAQQQFIIGAMCIDENFREQLFAAGSVAPNERRIQILSLIQNYGAGKDVQVDPSVADNVMNIVASGSPCRDAAEDAFQSVKADVCPCWPCF